MARGSYSRRRTEIKRDEMRETIRLNRIDANEAKAITEANKAMDRFFDTRGLGDVLTNDYRRVTVQVINLRVKQEEKQPFRRKAQDPMPAKSLKAAVLREIVMEARRRGVIKTAYQTEQAMPMVDWGVDDE